MVVLLLLVRVVPIRAAGKAVATAAVKASVDNEAALAVRIGRGYEGWRGRGRLPH